MMNGRIVLLIIFFTASFISECSADTIYLKNGRSIDGLVKKETEEKIELDVGFGTVTFRMSEIEQIERSDVNEVREIRQEWEVKRGEQEKEKIQLEKEQKAEKIRKKFRPKEVGFAEEGGHIIVNALLNKKVKAELVVDTGASTILLSSRIAKRLKIKFDKGKQVQVMMADGRKEDAVYIVLDTVSVEGVKAEDVGAVVLSNDSQMDIHDGLLGMSYLNKFNFQIDTVNKKLILKRRR